MIDFETVLRLRQPELKKVLREELSEMGFVPISRKGFLYAPGQVPVLLVAHLDTVHAEPPDIICYSQDGRYLMSPQGIGGDDRAGVYMILQILQRVNCHVLFCEDEERPGDHNQAMMDLGATICVPGTPDCAACPLREFCDAYAEGDPEELPVLPRKNPPKEIQYDVLLILSGNRVLMRQRTETLLEGMWVFPMAEGYGTAAALTKAMGKKLGMTLSYDKHLGEAKHVFTHQVWQMKLHLLHTEEATAPVGYAFVTAEDMNALAIPTAVAKAKKEVQSVLEKSI